MSGVKLSLDERLRLGARLAARSEPDGECRVWSGSKCPKSYGYIAFEGRTLRTHRAAYLVAHGEIPEGMMVCHRCDRPPCITPDHLFLGTAADNNHDMISKGRARGQISSAQGHFRTGISPRGEKGGGAKLSEVQALEAMQLRRSGVPTKALAERYSVDRTTIQRLMRGQNWKHLAGRAALEGREGQ